MGAVVTGGGEHRLALGGHLLEVGVVGGQVVLLGLRLAPAAGDRGGVRAGQRRVEGDLAGVRARLPYLRDLGVDALWFNPWYPSPQADNGYDIVDYRRVDPAYGTLADAEELIAAARAVGLRTIVDVVPNHVSNEHPWFREAVSSGPRSPARSRFWFRTGRGTEYLDCLARAG